MKKLIGTIVIAAFSTFSVNAETIENIKNKILDTSVSVGITGTAGMLEADGKETMSLNGTTGDVAKKAEDLFLAYGSIFAEVHMPMNFRVGLSYVPYSLESKTTESVHTSYTKAQGGTGEANRTQKVKASIEDLASLYVSYHLDMSAFTGFVKAGLMQGDLVTKEKLSTNSKYGNADLEGQFIGIGIDKSISNGIFIRGEAVKTQFDDIALNSTGSRNKNTIDITGLDGTNLSVSIGKTF